jgi:hypothetical protein
VVAHKSRISSSSSSSSRRRRRRRGRQWASECCGVVVVVVVVVLVVVWGLLAHSQDPWSWPLCGLPRYQSCLVHTLASSARAYYHPGLLAILLACSCLAPVLIPVSHLRFLWCLSQSPPAEAQRNAPVRCPHYPLLVPPPGRFKPSRLVRSSVARPPAPF